MVSIRILFVLLMSILALPVAAATVQPIAAGVTMIPQDADSIGDDVIYDGSFAIGNYSTANPLSFGIFDANNAFVNSSNMLTLNVGVSLLPGSNWRWLELVTFDGPSRNFVASSGLLDVLNWPTGGYLWNLDFSQLADQWFQVFTYSSSFGDAQNGFVSFTGVDSYTLGNNNPSPVPLPAGFPLLLAGLGAFGAVKRKQIMASIRQKLSGFSPSNVPAVPRAVYA